MPEAACCRQTRASTPFGAPPSAGAQSPEAGFSPSRDGAPGAPSGAQPLRHDDDRQRRGPTRSEHRAVPGLAPGRRSTPWRTAALQRPPKQADQLVTAGRRRHPPQLRPVEGGVGDRVPAEPRSTPSSESRRMPPPMLRHPCGDALHGHFDRGGQRLDRRRLAPVHRRRGRAAAWPRSWPRAACRRCGRWSGRARGAASSRPSPSRRRPAARRGRAGRPRSGASGARPWAIIPAAAAGAMVATGFAAGAVERLGGVGERVHRARAARDLGLAGHQSRDRRAPAPAGAGRDPRTRARAGGPWSSRRRRASSAPRTRARLWPRRPPWRCRSRARRPRRRPGRRRPRRPAPPRRRRPGRRARRAPSATNRAARAGSTPAPAASRAGRRRATRARRRPGPKWITRSPSAHVNGFTEPSPPPRRRAQRPAPSHTVTCSPSVTAPIAIATTGTPYRYAVVRDASNRRSASVQAM